MSYCVICTYSVVVISLPRTTQSRTDKSIPKRWRSINPPWHHVFNLSCNVGDNGSTQNDLHTTITSFAPMLGGGNSFVRQHLLPKKENHSDGVAAILLWYHDQSHCRRQCKYCHSHSIVNDLDRWLNYFDRMYLTPKAMMITIEVLGLLHLLYVWIGVVASYFFWDTLSLSPMGTPRHWGIGKWAESENDSKSVKGSYYSVSWSVRLLRRKLTEGLAGSQHFHVKFRLFQHLTLRSLPVGEKKLS